MGFVDIKCATLAASRSSYDDSSWRQTAFSQSVALMSLLCPSVRSEGWLSHVCVGDHSTVGPSLPVTYLPSVNGMSAWSVYHHWNHAYKAVLLLESSLFFPTRMRGLFIDRLGVQYSRCVCVLSTKAVQFLHVASNSPRFRLTDFKILQAFKVQNAVVQTFNIYL